MQEKRSDSTPNSDGHIRVLPLHVANKIAAGEVVERPASVVKELIENAIDAQAHFIRVSIVAGGRKLIAVRDDGCGMNKDDALLSLERQATSKIRDVDDIENIHTLGFRGEAIPSIASVSRFSITTRRKDSDSGTLLRVNAGTLVDVSVAGCPPGTLVEVRDLFCNVPARRKFLRAYATEEGHVKSIFTTQALAHPSIGFSLTLDDREVYSLAPTDKISDRIHDLFGEDFLDVLTPLETPPDSKSPIHISGYIERPNTALPTRREQYIFINGRAASAPSITYALKEAYPRRPGDSRPALFLFIDLPPTEVDVNVHPTKREVRFRNNAAIKEALVAAIDATFSAQLALKLSPAIPREPSLSASAFAKPAPAPHTSARPSFSVERERPSIPPSNKSFSTPPIIQRVQPVATPVQVSFPIEPQTAATQLWNWFHFLALTESGYLLIETDTGLVTVNPKAAAERITFEKLMFDSSKDNSETFSQQLLIPEIIHFSPADAQQINSALTNLTSLGFQIEKFGADSFKIDAVPEIMSTLPLEEVLATIAHDLRDTTTRKAGERWREEIIARTCARTYAGASTKLTEETAKQLIEDLTNCKMPYISPRGKQIMIFTSTRELDRRFSRE